MVKTRKVHITAVHDDVGAWLSNDPIQCLNIMNFAVRDIDKHWDRTLDVDHGVEFHGSFGTPKVSPRKQSQTQVDRGRVQGIEGSLKIESQVRIGVERPRNLNQSLREIGVDSPISEFVCIGKSGFLDQGTETGVIQLSSMDRQTDFDVAQTLAISELSKCHCEKLLPTGELSNAEISVVSFNASTEFIVRDVFDKLGENGSTAVHPGSTPSVLSRRGSSEPLKISNRLNRVSPLMH